METPLTLDISSHSHIIELVNQMEKMKDSLKSFDNASVADEGGGDGFCHTKLWDLNVTWNTDVPDFTPCFHQTVLTYIPAISVLILLPFQVKCKELESACAYLVL